MTEETKAKMGRPVIYDVPRERLGLRVSFETKARIEAFKKLYGVSQNQVMDFLVTYSYFDNKLTKACAKVYFDRGGDYLMSVDGRVAVRKEIETRR